jgi:hypothetical protein
MTFHKSDHMEYMRSGRKLSNKTLQTIAEYFQLIHETRENDGSLMRHQIKKIWAEAKRKLRHKLEEGYAHKKHLLSNQCRSYRSYHQRGGGHYCCQHGQHKQRKLHNNSSHSDDKCDNRKSPPKHKDKDFKPCCIHGKLAKHSYEECHGIRNCMQTIAFKQLRANNIKHKHNSHYNNNCYTISNDESRRSAHTHMPSDGDASVSNKSKLEESFYISEGKKNKKRRLGNAPSSSCSCKSGGTSKKHHNSDIDLDWDEKFGYAFVTDIEVADLKSEIQVENSFAFGK